MRSAAIAIAVVTACGGGHGAVDGGTCDPACATGEACRYATCVPAPASCTTTCAGDQYCVTSASECLPWGIGPGGAADRSCHDDPAPGVFFPVEQCAWTGPPTGDAYPAHRNVLATPMVAAFSARGPSIVFTAYNGSDKGGESCIGTDPALYGVIRVIDGATCEPEATLATPSVIASAALAIGDLTGDGTPEIVAARSAGGLVAFTRGPAGWQVLWQTPSDLADGNCDWTGPAIHDLDDDGHPEVIFYGAVYDGRTGEPIDESIGPGLDAIGNGYIPVVADVDNDGAPELVTGLELYGWDKAVRRWTPKRALPGSFDQVAVGDFGTYPAAGQDDRTRLDGVAEVVVVGGGVVRVINAFGREVFHATLQGLDGQAGPGGPPVIADFDGDGRAEIGVAGRHAYNVLDPDCQGVADAATCAARTSNGVLWAQPSRDAGPSFTASSAFDFDGDGKAEVVRGDECFTRIHDGTTGKVLASRARTSCLFYEHPVVADSDGDLHAELITASNASCAVSCPDVDPLFDGVACVDDGDCAGHTRCGRDQRDDALGRCRCAADPDCGDGYACRDPIAGPAPAGKVCRAAHAAGPMTGVHVLADAADRWGTARPIWNQHAYSVTNVDAAGQVPRTSQWPRNWAQAGLNSFRQNAPAEPGAGHARPDLTIRQAKVTCGGAAPTVTAEVCNRGGLVAAAGLPVAVYAATTPSKLRCETRTAAALAPGACATVSCAWDGPAGDGAVVVDDRGDGSGAARECREDNNTRSISVRCP